MFKMQKVIQKNDINPIVSFGGGGGGGRSRRRRRSSRAPTVTNCDLAQATTSVLSVATYFSAATVNPILTPALATATIVSGVAMLGICAFEGRVVSM